VDTGALSCERALRLPDELRPLLERGIDLFNEHQFFDCHDEWEEIWNTLRGLERIAVQGLIHCTVGFYHAVNGNVRGAASQFDKARTKLGPCGACPFGIDAQALLAEVSKALAWVEAHPGAGLPESMLPVINKCDGIVS
jgi:predicted metal-dependent hydrolase